MDTAFFAEAPEPLLGAVSGGNPAQQDENAPAVALRDVRVETPDARRVILDIPVLSIGSGERVALIGPTGAGKTTLLRLINGYVRPHAGSVRTFGVETATRGARRTRSRVGYVFQNFALVERASVLDNVLMGRLGRSNPWLSLAGRFSEKDWRIVAKTIEEVGLADHATQRADRLSGGQRQRVAIARAVVQESDLILADEPISNLDPVLSINMLDLLAAWARCRRATLVMSLHQPRLVANRALRVIALNAGRLVFDGPPAHLTGHRLQRIFQPAAGWAGIPGAG